jgi:hypothetical protein
VGRCKLAVFKADWSALDYNRLLFKISCEPHQVYTRPAGRRAVESVDQSAVNLPSLLESSLCVISRHFLNYSVAGILLNALRYSLSISCSAASRFSRFFRFGASPAHAHQTALAG